MNHVLLFHLEHGQIREAVIFASHYQHLVFFAHALEVLLHNAVEEDANSASEGHGEDPTQHLNQDLLVVAVNFLDHFDVALDVVVGCARKIEMTRWPRLFEIVGNPKSLFEVIFFISFELV